MDKLPYFLALVKKNVILYPFITSGALSGIDFKGYQTMRLSDCAIDIKNFKLSNEDLFSAVMIGISDLGLHINFSTNSAKYFDDPKKYFSRDTPIRKREYEMFEQQVKSNSKRLGEFENFIRLVDVTLYNSSMYGYRISLFFPSDKYLEDLRKERELYNQKQ